MIEVLRIKNLALIEDLTWELSRGMNVITGETGAGKSILIDAVSLLLGERADRTLIRDGATQCVVEGVLQVDLESGFFDDLGVDSPESGELILRRAFSSQGQSKQFINGSPTTVQNLRKLGARLVDLHGPHEHQSLLSAEVQRAALDDYAKLGGPLERYQVAFRRFKVKSEELDELRETDEGDWKERVRFLDFQIKEIEDAELSEEDENLEAEFDVASHAQSIREWGTGITEALSEAEGNVLEDLARVQRMLQEWAEIDPGVRELVGDNEGVVSGVQELLIEVESRASRTEVDEERLAALSRRLDTLQGLKRKYGSSVGMILESLQDLQKEKDQLAGREGRIDALEAELQELHLELNKLGKILGEARKKAAPRLGKDITKVLKELGFKKAELGVELRPLGKAGPSGLERIEFTFSPNAGESVRSLKAIASSGEMARVMLAVKTVLAKQDTVPVLIFDEVDANVGGETAVTVGQKLRGLADGHQVLCITHLPQVAGSGHEHFRVEKEDRGGRTVTCLKKLTKKERIDELGRMLGGASGKAKDLARELLV